MLQSFLWKEKLTVGDRNLSIQVRPQGRHVERTKVNMEIATRPENADGLAQNFLGLLEMFERVVGEDEIECPIAEPKISCVHFQQFHTCAPCSFIKRCCATVDPYHRLTQALQGCAHHPVPATDLERSMNHSRGKPSHHLVSPLLTAAR